jgi:hypothetical protein
MDLFGSPLAKMRMRVSKTPAAVAPYDAFEGLLKEKLVTWPKLSADRAAGFIMSVWISGAAKSGRLKIPKSDLNWIVSAGRFSRWKLRGAEAIWARELGAHLLQVSAETEAANRAGAPAQEEAAPD